MTVHALGIDERTFGLLVVPGVGVAVPLATLFGEEASLDPTARGGIAFIHVYVKRLDDDGFVGEVPAAVGGEVDGAVAGDAEPALLGGAVGPEHGVDAVGNERRLHDVPFHGAEQAAVAELARES